jgi:hypothetical protein
LCEECELKPKAHKPKRKREKENDVPDIISASYEVRVGLDPGWCYYLFIAKNRYECR